MDHSGTWEKVFSEVVIRSSVILIVPNVVP